jgi:hypothetical protein
MRHLSNQPTQHMVLICTGILLWQRARRDPEMGAWVIDSVNTAAHKTKAYVDLKHAFRSISSTGRSWLFRWH